MSWCSIPSFRTTDGCMTDTSSGHDTCHAFCLLSCVFPIDPWHGEVLPNCFCGKGNSHIPICIWCGVASRSKELLLPLCCALVGHLESWVWEHVWTFWQEDALARGQRRVTTMITGPDHLMYEERLRELQLFSLEKRRLGGLFLMNISTWRKRQELGSIQWLCSVKGTEAKSTNWNTGGFSENIRESCCHCESDQALVQIVQSGCGVSILGDSQKLPGYGPEQPAVR